MPKILAIDDRKDNLVALTALLANLMPGCEVMTALSGPEGVEKARTGQPDVILLDVQMPGMDGFETCRRLMADESTRSIPVVMITAIRTDSKSRVSGLEIGANAYLAKPIDSVELVSQIRVSLRVKAAEDALRQQRDSLEQMVEERTRELRESAEHLQAIAAASPDADFVYDADGRFIEVNPVAVERYGYSRDEFLNMTLRDLCAPDLLDQLENHLRQALTDGLRIEWRHRCKDGREIPVEVAVKPFTLRGRPCAYGSARDISERKRAEEENKQSRKRLHKAFGATIQVIAGVVEGRDPYTAGHQKRVSALARAIAQKMGLSGERMQGLRVAAVIHDIGKVFVPAEFLSKPSKLTDLEFSLIKGHSQSGHEILEKVDFPWPIARIVLEHHERINGTGYPNALTGEKLLPESRILAVADVVEAISSHRPYRPALGIDAALEEIAGNRNILYDPQVVDACLELFRKEGYSFNGVTPIDSEDIVSKE